MTLVSQGFHSGLLVEEGRTGELCARADADDRSTWRAGGKRSTSGEKTCDVAHPRERLRVYNPGARALPSAVLNRFLWTINEKFVSIRRPPRSRCATMSRGSVLPKGAGLPHRPCHPDTPSPAHRAARPGRYEHDGQEWGNLHRRRTRGALG